MRSNIYRYSFLLIIAGIACCSWIPDPRLAFIAIFAAMAAASAVCGMRVTGQALGIIINDRNVMSLSRAQALLWTMLIMSGFLAIAYRHFHLHPDAFIPDPGFNPSIITLLAISGTTMVGAPLALSGKANTAPSRTVVENAANLLNDAALTPQVVAASSKGLLYGNPGIQHAQLADLIEGDEIANTAYVDLAKLQMLYVTIITAIVFVATLFHALTADGSGDVKFPEIPATLLALMGISNSAYMINKAVPK